MEPSRPRIDAATIHVVLEPAGAPPTSAGHARKFERSGLVS